MSKFRTMAEHRDNIFSNSYLDEETGCWVCMLQPNQERPYTYLNGKHVTVAKLSYLLHKGPIPKSIEVCHTCDNPRCVNPEHLFLGTKRDNQLDKVSKGRHATGSKNGAAILNEEAVAVIKQLLINGKSQKNIAKTFGVSISCISMINKEHIWKYVQACGDNYE